METHPTNYGELKGITSATHYKSGGLKSCMVNQKNCLQTPFGDIVPQYRSAEFGERQKKHRSSLDFFEDGQIKSAALDSQAELDTPIGPIKAELVTFYPEGSINRIFPLNGLIDGYWSENNEREIAELMDFDLPIGQFRAKVISIHFYPSGALKTLTIWPGQVIQLQTPLGQIACRAGFSLYEDGSLRSAEPASIVEIPTPIGLIKAYDPEIIGMHADQNSLQFSKTGTLSALTTIHSGICTKDSSGEETRVEPYEADSYVDPTQLRTVPMKIEFSPENVRIEAREFYEYELSACQFASFAHQRVSRAVCNGCPNDDTCCQNGGEGVGESGGCCGGCGG